MEKNKVMFFGLVLLVLLLALAGLRFTGLVVYNAPVNTSGVSDVTKTEAINAINASSLIVEKLRKENFSVSFFENLLEEASQTLEIADYASILRDSSSTSSQKQMALLAVKLIDWKRIDYGSVLNITESIKSRATETYTLSDRLLAEKLKIETVSRSGVNISESESKLMLANLAFKNERYDETNRLILETRASLEKAQIEAVQNKSLKIASMNFFRRYWAYILVFSAIFTFAFIVLYRKIRIFNLRRKIDKMRAEKQALNNLLIRAQKERFKENKISGLVYNVRFKNYQQRMNQIDEEIPVLEAKLAQKPAKKLK